RWRPVPCSGRRCRSRASSSAPRCRWAGPCCPTAATSAPPWPPPPGWVWSWPCRGGSATSGTRPSATTSRRPGPARPSATCARCSPRSATATALGTRTARPRPAGVRLVAGWLGATVVVLAAEHPLWRSHVSHLIPPAALLVAAVFDRLRRRLPAAAVAVAAVVACAVVPYHLVHLSEVLWPAPPGPALAA